MGLRLGKRKIAALLGVGLVAAAAAGAWWIWETDGLLAVLLATSVGATLGLGWFTAQSERRVRSLVSKLQDNLTLLQHSQDSQLQTVDRRFDDVVQHITCPSEHAEQLLRAIHAAFKRIELTQERFIDSSQAEVKVAHDRIVKTVRSDADKIAQALERHAQRASKQVGGETKQLFRQIEALLALYASARPATAFPPTRTWAASPDLLVFLHQIVRTRQPQLILECGSGVSTLVMGYALKENGAGRVVALEHLDEYRETTVNWVRAHELEEWIDVRSAPLAGVKLDRDEWPWYSMDAIPEGEIDLLFVDGPPGSTRANARYPAVPILAERLSPGGLVILDDFSRDEETSVADEWAKLYPGWEKSTFGHEKGTVTFTKVGNGGQPGPGRTSDLPG